MTIQVTGQLKNSSGAPSPNTPISLLTIKGADGVLPTAVFDTITDGEGSYDFSVNNGVHYLAVRYETALEKVAKITVNTDTPSPINIDELLGLSEPLTPDQILQVQRLVKQATDAANSASNNANKVAQNKDEVAQNTQTVSEKTQIVVDAQSNVIEKAQQVATNTETVNEKTQTVLDAQADVTEKANQVASDAQQVSSDKQTVLDAKSDVTAKANQAASDAQQVSENASQVALDKGSVDEAAEEIATAQAVIGTSIDGVYANAAAIVSLNDTILRLHPII